MENRENWADDVVKIPVVKWVDKEHHEDGFMFTDAFERAAKEDGFVGVTFQFRKGHPEESVLKVDSVNCSMNEFDEVINLIKQFNFNDLKIGEDN